MIAWHLDHAVGGAWPSFSGWLSEGEEARAAAFTVPKRRADWLSGRFAAKRLVRRVWADAHGDLVPVSAIEIANEPSGVPFARLAAEAGPAFGFAAGERFPLALSISHADGWALAAVCPSEEAGLGLGADVERMEPRSPEFVRDFLTRDEARLAAASADDGSPTVLWSAKESVLKALGVGLSADTRDVVCRPLDAAGGWHVTDAWQPFAVDLKGPLASPDRRACGCWRRFRELVLTLARLDEERGGTGNARARDLDPHAA